MKRSQFCKNLLVPGLACSCVPGLLPIQDNPSAKPGETPCTEKMEFTHKWLKRFFEIMDQQIDEPARVMLMQSNGVACAKGAYGELTDMKEATIGEIDEKIVKWQERLGRENIYRSGNTVYFNYVSNPKGLKISDGYCLCPMIEDGPVSLSPTYCQCSAGYVRYMFQKLITFKPVRVELLESLRGGGKSCRFKVTI